MAFRFWRRVKIAPGVTLNLSKSGGSLSFGPRGAKVTVGPRGSRATVGVPGTGLFYTTKLSGGGTGRGSSGHAAPAVPTVRPQDRLTLGFFSRLVTPKDEQAFVDGCREHALGDKDAAFALFEQSLDIADSAYMAGLIALDKDLPDKAAQYLEAAARGQADLGRHFSKYGVSPVASLPITDEISAHIGASLRGVLLALVETYQRQKKFEDALTCLHRLQAIDPGDPVVTLSLAELLLEVHPGDKDACKKVVELVGDAENTSAVATALMLYKARALRGLGLADAAKDILTAALRRRKDRPDDLLHALRYERALAYEDLGQKARARADLEKLYAQDPNYEDVAKRLGL